MASKAILKKSNYNKENEGGPLNMLRKVQRTRKEQMEKKISSKLGNSNSQTLKENRNYSNNHHSRRSSKIQGLSKLKLDITIEQKMESFSVRETRKTMLHYAKDMLSELKSKQDRYWPRNSLDNHSISPNVDWMIEVLCSYKCTDMTFFVAVNYMDSFFKKTTEKHELNDLHLVGVASMYLATKYEEICPLRISIMQNKISHGKFTKEEIRKKETDLIQAMDFFCSPVTTLHFVEFGIQSLELRDELSEKLYNHLQKLSVYIAKMSCHDYDLLNKYNQSQFAAACIYIGLKIIQQLESGFKIDHHAYKLRNLFGISDNMFFTCSQNVLDLAKNFESRYPSLGNLSKFHSFSLDDPGFSSEENKSAASN